MYHPATGRIAFAEIQGVLDELNETARGLAYEKLAGEEPINFHELLYGLCERKW